ncbi:MAG: hypothetical protein LBJ41_01225 [Treponema sp.]|nr:hypothetical protein [Treponema sp.]
MANRNILLGMVVLVLLFSLTLVGCDSGYTSSGGTSGGGTSGGGTSGDGTSTSTIRLTTGTYVCTYAGQTYRISLISEGTAGTIIVTSVPSGSGFKVPSMTLFSYSITGTSMEVSRGSLYASAYYTVSSTTSFYGYGETWTKTAN